MGILKTITEEYFGNTIREEDEINIDGLDVEIVSFTDNNGKKHGTGYKPKDRDTLKELLERLYKKYNHGKLAINWICAVPYS